jgi:hypothetical protein
MKATERPAMPAPTTQTSVRVLPVNGVAAGTGAVAIHNDLDTTHLYSIVPVPGLGWGGGGRSASSPRTNPPRAGPPAVDSLSPLSRNRRSMVTVSVCMNAAERIACLLPDAAPIHFLAA